MYINPWIPLNNPWIQSVFSTKSNECHAKSHESHVWFCCRLFGYEGLLMDLDLDLTFWGVVFIRPMSSITGNFNFKIYILSQHQSHRELLHLDALHEPNRGRGVTSHRAQQGVPAHTRHWECHWSLADQWFALERKQPGAKIGPAHTHTQYIMSLTYCSCTKGLSLSLSALTIIDHHPMDIHINYHNTSINIICIFMYNINIDSSQKRLWDLSKLGIRQLRWQRQLGPQSSAKTLTFVVVAEDFGRPYQDLPAPSGSHCNTTIW